MWNWNSDCCTCGTPGTGSVEALCCAPPDNPTYYSANYLFEIAMGNPSTVACNDPGTGADTLCSDYDAVNMETVGGCGWESLDDLDCQDVFPMLRMSISSSFVFVGLLVGNTAFGIYRVSCGSFNPEGATTLTKTFPVATPGGACGLPATATVTAQ